MKVADGRLRSSSAWSNSRARARVDLPGRDATLNRDMETPDRERAGADSGPAQPAGSTSLPSTSGVTEKAAIFSHSALQRAKNSDFSPAPLYSGVVPGG